MARWRDDQGQLIAPRSFQRWKSERTPKAESTARPRTAWRGREPAAVAVDPLEELVPAPLETLSRSMREGGGHGPRRGIAPVALQYLPEPGHGTQGQEIREQELVHELRDLLEVERSVAHDVGHRDVLHVRAAVHLLPEEALLLVEEQVVLRLALLRT